MASETSRLLPGLALLLMAIALLAVWQISRVDFQPATDSIDLGKGYTVKLRQAGESSRQSCPDSIGLAEILQDDFNKGTLQMMLWSCVESIRAADQEAAVVAALPHEWRNETALQTLQSGELGKVLYSIDYPISYWPEDGFGLWSLVVTGTGHNLAVFLNGKLLGWGGSFAQPYARNHARPLEFSIPDGNLKEGNNRFDILVVSEMPSEGFLGKVYIAPTEMLRSAYRVYHFFRFIAPQIIALGMATLGVLMGLLWLYRRTDPEYGLFGLIGVFWSVHTLDQFIVSIPLSTAHWNALIYGSLACWCCVPSCLSSVLGRKILGVGAAFNLAGAGGSGRVMAGACQ
ncbi:MAG: hypothetical protein R3E95_23140 [Thiolinea sp.]